VRHRTLACAFTGALLLASGCGERAEPVGELSQTYPVSVRGAGESPTVLERPPRRIVALDPGSAELVAALGAGRRLVGVPALAGRGRAVEVVTAAGTVDVDAVVDLRPDLVVGTTSTDPLDLARAARESGAASYLQPSASVADVQRGVVELGFLLGRAPKARQLVGDIRVASCVWAPRSSS
jgi:iron complex transport system substrate-binding protein